MTYKKIGRVRISGHLVRFMIKRIIAAVLAGSLWVGCVLPSLTGCSGGKGSDSYTVAEWLDKVETDFNMLYFTSEEPYFANVTAENEDYNTVQIAAEWGLVDPSQGIRLADKVTKEFAADTLVTAMAFDYDVDAGITDADKISDPKAAAIAVNEGVFTLDGSGKFDPKKTLTREEADAAAAAAYDKWLNVSYDESYDNSVVKEDVINLGGISSDIAEVAPATYDVIYSGNLNVIDENGYYSDKSTKTIVFAPGQNIGVKVGSILTLPADSQTPTPFAVVVDSITENSDGTVTVQTHNAEMNDVYDRIDVQFSERLDINDAVIYDMDGNRLSGGVETSENVSYAGGSVLANGLEDYSREYMKTSNKATAKIKVAEGISVICGKNDDKWSIGVELEKKEDGAKIKGSITDDFSIDIDFKIKDVSIDDLWNGGKFYTRFCKTVNSKLTGTAEFSLKSEDFFGSQGAEGALANNELSQLYDMCYKYLETTQEKFDKLKLSKQIYVFVFPTAYGDIQIPIKFTISLSGKITVVAEQTNKSGFEWNYGKFRPIDETESGEKTCDIEAKFETYFSLGVAWGKFNVQIVNLMADLGIGGKINNKIYVLDGTTGAVTEQCALPTGMFGGGSQSNNDLASDPGKNIQLCADGVFYPLFRITLCTSDCLLGKLGCSLSVDIVGEDKPFFNWHLESDNGLVDNCTREGGMSYDIKEGSNIELTSPNVGLAIGETNEKLRVTTLPKGYSAKDIVFESENSNIASAENLIGTETEEKNEKKVTIKLFNVELSDKYTETMYKKYGHDDNAQVKLTGVADGVSILKVSTKDGLYSTECKILVGNGGIKERTANAFVIETYSLVLTPGASTQIVVTSAPEGYDMSQVTFKSNDESVATVSGSGIVKAVGSGQTSIMISTTDGKYTSACMVFVGSEGSAV